MNLLAALLTLLALGAADDSLVNDESNNSSSTNVTDDEFYPGWYQQAFTISGINEFHFNLYIGTPPQMVTVYLDYGSADFFITSGANNCANETCSVYGYYPLFNNNDTSSLVHSGSFFTSSLSSDSLFVSAEWVTDNILFQNVTLNDTFLAFFDVPTGEEMSSSYSTSSYIEQMSQLCFLGLGPLGLEETVQWVYNGSPGPTYNNFLYSLPKVPPLFSVWVNPTTKTDGVITFGALDEKQYAAGSLVTVPIVNENNLWSTLSDPVYLGVAIFSLSLNQLTTHSVASFAGYSGGTSYTLWVNQTLVVSSDVAILDSKANFSLPQVYLQQVGSALSAVWSGSQGMYLVRCDLQGEIVLEISGFEFRIPLQEQLIPFDMYDSNGLQICGLRIGVSKTIILSNNVLKNYFLAVDYDSNQIAFGSAIPTDTPQSIASNSEIARNTMLNGTPAPLYQYSKIASGQGVPQSLTYAPTGLVLDASFSTAYVLGGTPAPSIETQLNNAYTTRTMAKATEASNGGHQIRTGLLFRIGAFLWCLL